MSDFQKRSLQANQSLTATAIRTLYAAKENQENPLIAQCAHAILTDLMLILSTDGGSVRGELLDLETVITIIENSDNGRIYNIKSNLDILIEKVLLCRCTCIMDAATPLRDFQSREVIQLLAELKKYTCMKQILPLPLN